MLRKQESAPGAGPTDGGPEPSPEELLALVELLQQQGLNMDQVPDDLKTMLDNVKRQKATAGKGPAAPEAPTEEITPEPGFVIKTTESKTGGKVFINVCSHERVAAPGGWTNGIMPDEVAAALEKLQNAGGDAGAANMSPGEVEALRFPLACGPPRPDTDRKGAACTAIDVVFNSDVVRAAATARKLKAMIIEVSLGWVGNKLGGELDPRYKLPKMRYKGEVVASQRIRADDKRKKLVTELRDVDEEPSFALRTKKAPTPPPVLAQAPTPAASAVPSTLVTSSSPAQQAAGQNQSSSPAAAPSVTPTYKVEYEGRPVQWVQVTVDIPPSASPAVAAQHTQGVSVDLCGRSLYVRAGPGSPELHVPLQFAVSAEGASATWQQQHQQQQQQRSAAAAGGGKGPGGTLPQQSNQQLVVRLPYRGLDDYLADARAQAPLAFGQLSFASKALLELEP
ncbi:hypothetical protein HYH02_005421 [Chlamydomonas schloesseri]|uniref:PIH1 N-terminal domain-containing protein n=1 Tax=Chlamydomonas schloesseri TaxID=2026947 RepID=A0A835WKB1_9CHLO|nr:hypothetical protein HYH02_005421 [Chlamydomonas schloesseri]|eukprot:KAG2449264.1 hypothetical protein HYH02_005421 [Chlamydomonas schloesseri]